MVDRARAADDVDLRSASPPRERIRGRTECARRAAAFDRGLHAAEWDRRSVDLLERDVRRPYGDAVQSGGAGRASRSRTPPRCTRDRLCRGGARSEIACGDSACGCTIDRPRCLAGRPRRLAIRRRSDRADRAVIARDVDVHVRDDWNAEGRSPVARQHDLRGRIRRRRAGADRC